MWRRVGESRAQVDELLKVQQRLRIVLGGEGDNGLGAPSRSSLVSVAEATDGATAAASGPLTSARLAGLRQLIGKAVRTQAEQQHEIDRLTEQLREERTASGTAALRSSTAAADADALRERVATLEAQLADERRERMESESAAMEREERLEERVEELLEQERHRIELQKAVVRREKAMERMEVRHTTSRAACRRARGTESAPLL